MYASRMDTPVQEHAACEFVKDSTSVRMTGCTAKWYL
jgi:hypothetical protein